MDYIMQTSTGGNYAPSPVQLTGVEQQDIRALVKGAPITDGRFQATFEGELFCVERRVRGQEDRIRACNQERLKVFDYQAAALEMLIGGTLPARRGDGVTPASSILVVAPISKHNQSRQALVVIQDTYLLRDKPLPSDLVA